MLTHVDKPLQIAGVTLKNRVARSAHATGLAPGRMSDELIAYHVARARGGVGLSILEIMSVHPTSPSGLNAWGRDMSEGYNKLMAACEPYDTVFFQQLWHGGHNATPAGGGPPWSASDLPGTSGVVPIPMTQAMIDEVIAGYADAARKCVALGVKGVEVHCAHGYLPAQFMSPNTNERTDHYGGSRENRIRFAMEAVRAVRAAVPAGYPVGVRVAPDMVPGGVDVDLCIYLCQQLEAEELIDFVDCSLGNYETFDRIFEGMHVGAGYEMPTSAAIAAAVKSPTLATGRFRTLEEADAVIRAGEAAFISMTRAHIADPDIVAKTLDGRPEDVRPCIGCNQGCVAGLLELRRIGCTVNPAVGSETRMGEDKLVPAATPRSVLVVGGGPSGMEAARVAALRGHKVTLLEAAPHLGGAVKLARKAPNRAGIDDITVWLEEQVYKLKVDVRLSTYAEVDDVLAENPDAVIVATGSHPRMDGRQSGNSGEHAIGMDSPILISSHDLFEATPSRNFGRRAVVVDDVGHYEGIAATEMLLSLGLSVTYVTRHTAFAPLMEATQMNIPALQRFAKHDFDTRLRTRVISVDASGVVIGPTYLSKDTNRTERLEADTVVFISPNRPNRDLVEQLCERGVETKVVGDANSPRFLQVAIREGHLAGAAV